MPPPLPAAFHETACSRERQSDAAPTRRIQPPFGCLHAVMTPSVAASVLPVTANAPVATAATAAAAASTASTCVHRIFMWLLPSRVTRLE